jgi:hypothetical protein
VRSVHVAENVPVGREPAEQPQRQRYPSFGAKQRVARREDQAQQVVTDLVIERAFELLEQPLGLSLRL